MLPRAVQHDSHMQNDALQYLQYRTNSIYSIFGEEGCLGQPAPPTFARSLGESLGFMPYFLISAASCSSSILSGGGLDAAILPDEACLARSHRLPAAHIDGSLDLSCLLSSYIQG